MSGSDNAHADGGHNAKSTYITIFLVLAFLTAPLVAVLNFRAVRAPHMPAGHRPGPWLTALSWAGIVFRSSSNRAVRWWSSFLD